MAIRSNDEASKTYFDSHRVRLEAQPVPLISNMCVCTFLAYAVACIYVSTMMHVCEYVEKNSAPKIALSAEIRRADIRLIKRMKYVTCENCNCNQHHWLYS